MSKFHIIAFDVPYPPNYGGIVDVFYKLKSLSEAGAEIIYHCFYYKGHNPPHELLDQYCSEIYYYERKKQIHKLFSSPLPYVVASRNNKALLKRLLKDDLPILFDGIQTCYYLNHPVIKKRKRLFRANNIEHAYYDGLAKWETSAFKKQYLMLEARRLRRFEKQITGVDAILSVAKMDVPHFEQYAPTYHVPPFFNSHNLKEVDPSTVEKHVLFQGNLSVKENEHAAKFIIEKVAPLSDHHFVIAGKSPSRILEELCAKQDNVTLIDTPPLEKMDALIQNAQVNLLLTFQQTGIKLKLLHALESGRHIIINQFMDDSGIFASMCHVRNTAEEIANCITELMDIPFDTEQKKLRDEAFDHYYNNATNAQQILNLIGQ